jgi:hypothetical protein
MKAEIRRPPADEVPLEDPQTWHNPAPETLPPPTYCPAVLALGIVFLLWGVVTTPAISAVGLVLCIIALSIWIGELRHGNH